MIEVYRVVPEYGVRGSPPTRMKPGSDWMYLQMVKRRHVHGRVQATKIGVIYGSKAEVTAHLGESTAYIERSNLTDHIGRLSERETYL